MNILGRSIVDRAVGHSTGARVEAAVPAVAGVHTPASAPVGMPAAAAEQQHCSQLGSGLVQAQDNAQPGENVEAVAGRDIRRRGIFVCSNPKGSCK